MRARLRYSIVSPRAPRRCTGYLAGLLLAAMIPAVLLLIGLTAPVVSHGAVALVVLAVGA